MGRPRQIDRSTILEASLAIADEAGLPAVTMQAVAARIGVTPMALYRHVGGKAALLDGLVESLLAEIPLAAPSAGSSAPWDDQLVEIGLALRAVAWRHPSAFPLLLQRPAATDGARHVRDHVYGVLRAAGVAPDQLQRVERIVSTLAIGFAAGEVSGRFKGSRAALEVEFRALAIFIRAGIAPFREAALARPGATRTARRGRAARAPRGSRSS